MNSLLQIKCNSFLRYNKTPALGSHLHKEKVHLLSKMIQVIIWLALNQSVALGILQQPFIYYSYYS